jgi:DNA-binding transcriptional LysR family regulator
MEMGRLRALREVQARGSIAAAAAALHVTASSVSQQLAALQRKTGTALTYKEGRRTALTPAGLALCRAAADVEVALARADTAVERFSADAGPRLALSDGDVAQQDFAALAADHDLVIAHRLANSPAWPGAGAWFRRTCAVSNGFRCTAASRWKGPSR